MLFLLTCLFIALLSLVLFTSTTKPKNYPPGPQWLPFVGNFIQFRRRLSEVGYHHLVYQELSELYGDVVGLKMGRNLVVITFSPEAVKEVLTKEEFDGRPDGFFFRLRTFGKRLGIVFSDGQFWQKQRKFSLQHLRNFGFGRKEMEEKIEDETRELIKLFKNQSHESESVWMHSAFDVSVVNVLWAMMAGERFQVNDERLLKLLRIIHDAFRLTDMSGGMLNQMPFLRFIAPTLCGYTQNLNILTRMWEFLEETISAHRRTLCGTHARDLIDAFLQKMDVKNDSSFTDDQLMSLCLDLFMAGSETTSNTLGFSMIYMLEYPEIQKKVQDEIDLVVGRNRWPTLQDRIKLKYTEAVLMEIQRRANIPPLGIAHRATKNANLCGYSVPEGAIVLTSLYSVHMDEKFWKDPLAFRPERFLDENGNLAVNEKYFIPFGYGKRRCLGESLAKASYFMFFTALLHNFFIQKDFDGPLPQLEGFDGVTISPKPFKAKLIPRND